MTTWMLIMTLLAGPALAADFTPEQAAAELVDITAGRADLDEAEVLEALERLRAKDVESYAKVMTAIERFDEAPDVHGKTLKKAVGHLMRHERRAERREEMAAAKAELAALKQEILVLAQEHAEANRKQQADIEAEIRDRITEILEAKQEMAQERIDRASQRLEKAKAELAELQARQDDLVEEYLDKALRHGE